MISTTPPANLRVQGNFGSLNGTVFIAALDLKNPTGLDYGMFGPISTFSLANFSEARLNVTDPNTANVLFAGTITSLTTVPEPAMATVLCVAVAGWLAHARRRRTRAAWLAARSDFRARTSRGERRPRPGDGRSPSGIGTVLAS